MANSSLLNQVILRFQPELQLHREDLSALLLDPSNYLWLASDETATLERLSLGNNNEFGNHQQFPLKEYVEIPHGEGEEVDIEGLDYADHYLWLIGSHSTKRKTVKPENSPQENADRLATIEFESNRYLLARIPLVDGQLFRTCPHPEDPEKELTAAKLEQKKKGNLLTNELKDDRHLGIFLSAPIPGKENGFDLEGIAAYKNRVFLGLRGPVLRGWAVILELELKEDDPGLLKLKKIGEDDRRYKKHFLNLQGLGVRDLLVDGEDLLILAGPTMDLDGPVKVFRWQNVTDLPDESLSEPAEILDVPFGNRDDHAEGITLFEPIAQQPSLLIVYDSPCKATRLQDPDGVLADVFSLQTGEQNGTGKK